MAKNKYGLDTDHIGKNLAILQRDLAKYTPIEMRAALTVLANTYHPWAQRSPIIETLVIFTGLPR